MRPEHAVVLLVGGGRVVERGLHRVAGAVNAPSGSSSTDGPVGRVLADEAEEHPARVDEVAHEVAGRPVVTRGGRVPTVVGDAGDALRHRGGEVR